MMTRHGSGRVKHLEIKQLWCQQAIASGRFVLNKADTEHNEADIGTKSLPADRVEYLLSRLNLRWY